MTGKAVVLSSIFALTVAETPTPEDDIVKLACQVASQKDIEDKETAKVCELIKEKAPYIQFLSDCQTGFESVWDKVAAHCPPTPKATTPITDVEKAVCELLSQKEIEAKETAKVCKLIKEKYPFIQFTSDCQTGFESVWDNVMTHCPKVAMNKAVLV